MENCGRENKNRFVFAFCALLVELGVFRKIKFSFLMVGHTQEDVDQMFSRFSTYLRRTDMDDLTSAFEKSYTPMPTAILLENVHEFCSWLHPQLDDMCFHSEPHVFKFISDKFGKAVMVIKKWSTDIQCVPCTGSVNGHFLTDTYLKGHHFLYNQWTPLLVQPKYSRDNDLDLLHDGLKHAVNFLTPEALHWWECWFKDLKYNEGKKHNNSVPLYFVFFVVFGSKAYYYQESV